ncbi:diguanylate cyclase [Hahella ganghwensis]|uniref:diguanylate cyclase n=1 Tax=Hahella ganghwensis TaxID=286420 RepID=UPI000380E348|nr:diguanylate cyclase [Hahella ganghwensis]
MNRKTDLSEAIQYLKQTLPEMSKRKIPTTPENYAVWYEYTVGKNLGLKSHVYELDKKQSEYTDEVNAELYEKYILCSSEQAEINKLKDSVRKIITELLDNLADEGEQLSDFSKTLQQFSAQIQHVSTSDGLQEMIKELLTETRKREHATHNLQQTVCSMANDIKDLRQEMERLNEEANTDSLTRVKNRRAFDIALDKAVHLSAQEQAPLSVILIDIDCFKQFNDQFGHSIGDKVLRYVASSLTQCVRGSDDVARVGGEEFAILLPDTSYEGAMSVAENCRLKISKQPLSDSKENKKLGSLTISAGVGSYQSRESIEDLMRRADACLYQSKRNGRNKVTGEKELEGNLSEDFTWI